LRPRNVLKNAAGNIFVVDDIVTENDVQTKESGKEPEIRFQIDNIIDNASLNTGAPVTDELREQLRKKIHTGWHKFSEAHFDRWLPVKKFIRILEDAGAKISDANNYYLRADAMTSAIDAQYKAYEKKYSAPLAKAVADLKAKGFSMRDVENYAILKFGTLERNPQMKQEAVNEYKKKHPKASAEDMRKFTEGLPADYSGVTAIEEKTGNPAEQFIEEFEAQAGQEAIDRFWEAKKRATDYSLLKMYASGGITKAGYDKFKAGKYYVPLRGHDRTVAEDMYDYSPNMGTYFSSPMEKAKGRRSRSENPFAYIDQLAMSATKFANWNLLNQSWYRLAGTDKTGLLSREETWYEMTGPDEEGNPVWEAREPEHSSNPEAYSRNRKAFEERMRALAKAGLAEQRHGKFDIGGVFIKPGQRKQHRIPVWVDGREYSVYVNADPAVSRSVNGLNVKPGPDPEDLKFLGKVVDGAGRGWRDMDRFIATNITARSPEFVVSNFERDLIHAATVLPVKENAGYAKQFLDNLPKSAEALARFLSGNIDMHRETDMELYRFMMNGGKTGYTHFLELQKVQKKFEREVRRARRSRVLNSYGLLKYIPDTIDAANTFAENLSRFAVYLTSIENGRSVYRAVSDAKEVTVNFNRSGSGYLGNKWLRANFLFVNPALQAMYNLGNVAKDNPVKTRILVTAFLSLGVLAPMLARLLGRDDGEDAYWSLPEWNRQNNFNILFPNTGFGKVALPQELRSFTKIGDNMMAGLTGRKNAVDAVVDSALGFLDMSPVNPLGVTAEDFRHLEGKSILGKLTPDKGAPFVEVAVNRNFAGMPIFDEWANEDDPGHVQAKVNRKGEYKSPKWMVGVSRAVNDVTGGDDVNRGVISFNPDKVNHILRSYLGGMYSTGTQAIDAVQTGIDPERDVKIRNTPLRAFFTSLDDIENREVYDRFYRLREEILEYDRKYSRHSDRIKDDGEFMQFMEKHPDINTGSSFAADVRKIKRFLNELKGMNEKERREEEALIKKDIERLEKNYGEAMNGLK
jgi:hypothetical protein